MSNESAAPGRPAGPGPGAAAGKLDAGADVPLEAAVVKAIVAYLHRAGAWVRKPAKTEAGDPDLFVCYRGRFLAVEVKRPGGGKGTSKIQDWTLGQIRGAGGAAIVAESVEDVRQALLDLDAQEAIR